MSNYKDWIGRRAEQIELDEGLGPDEAWTKAEQEWADKQADRSDELWQLHKDEPELCQCPECRGFREERRLKREALIDDRFDHGWKSQYKIRADSFRKPQ